MSKADYVISIAVLHHMASIERRLSALGEIGRILKRGGKAMVTSWATDQSGNGGSNYVKKTVEDHNGPKSTPLPIHKGKIIFILD